MIFKKKRFWILLGILLIIVLGTFIPYTKPVLPVIQLPGEVYPGTEGIPILGNGQTNGITNTFVAAVLAFVIVLGMGLSLRARSRTADEVPTGFYNFFEMIVEGGLNFAVNLAGSKKAKEFFPLFMTVILFVLVANWMELIPGVDSIGIWEWKPHLEAVREVEAEGLEEGTSEFEHLFEDVEHEVDAANDGAFRDGLFMVRAAKDGDIDQNDSRAGRDPEKADWALVPFIRAAATDLNFTLALSLVTMAMVQFYGFKYQGLGYLKKFFALDIGGIAKNPMKMMDPIVGILELVGEISRVISFAFRLLGSLALNCSWG